MFKQVLVQQVARAVASEMSDRPVRMESISDIEAEAQERLHGEAEQVVSELTEGISYAGLYKLLTVASQQGLFSDGMLVKTSNERGRPLIEVSRVALLDNREGVSPSRLQLQVFSLQDNLTDDSEFLKFDDDSVTWESEDDVQDMIDKVLLMFQRLDLQSHEGMLSHSSAI